MRNHIALILALAFSLALLAAPALALTLTADQEQALADYADRMTDFSPGYDRAMTVEMYMPSVSAYVICDYSMIYSSADVELIGSTISDALHSSFTEVVVPSRLETFAEMGIDEINIIGITYSKEGHIIYLSINGTDMSDLANFS